MDLNSGKNFLFLPAYKKNVDLITAAETKNLLLNAIIDYGITGDYNKNDPIVNSIMINISESINLSTKKQIKSLDDSPYKAFVFYSTYKKCIDSLPTKKDRELLLNAIVDYGTTRDYDKTNSVVNAIMMNVVKNIDSSEARYKKCRENGALGGRPRKTDYDEIYWTYDRNKRKMSLTQIAYLNNVSERTVQRALAYRCALAVARKKAQSNSLTDEQNEEFIG